MKTTIIKNPLSKECCKNCTWYQEDCCASDSIWNPNAGNWIAEPDQEYCDWWNEIN